MQPIQQSQYELLRFPDPHFPIIFHRDTCLIDDPPYTLHWHDAIELLFLVSGECRAIHNGTPLTAKKGDIVIFDSNCLHTMYAVSQVCQYDCMIIDSSFLTRCGLFVSELQFQPFVQSSEACSLYEKIAEELHRKRDYYKPVVSALVLELAVCLSRGFASKKPADPSGSATRLNMVKDTITFIQTNYMKPLTVDTICRHAGFSKYYLCHNFKEFTGYTVIEYLTITRCRQAWLLLASGDATVSQAARFCQFNHLSHFSKTFKKYMGELPGTVKKQS